MLLWMVSGIFLTLLALGVAGARARSPLPGRERDEARGDLEVAALTVLTLLVTPIVWPHYYVVLVMPVFVVATYLGRLILDGSVRSEASPRPAGDLDLGLTAPAGQRTGPAQAYDRRRRVLPTIAVVILAVSTAALALAHYVEPFAGVGGQQLVALLALYGAALIALGWSVRAQGRGVSPALAR